MNIILNPPANFLKQRQSPMSAPAKADVVPTFSGYQPADVLAALGADVPERALFTTFTFSPGAFHQQYLTPLLQHGCRDVAVLADPVGYAQSLFGAAAVQGVGTDYRLRQATATGAFHGKLVFVRTRRSALVGVGSGNLTASGLLMNAEVGRSTASNGRSSWPRSITSCSGSGRWPSWKSGRGARPPQSPLTGTRGS